MGVTSFTILLTHLVSSSICCSSSTTPSLPTPLPFLYTALSPPALITVTPFSLVYLTNTNINFQWLRTLQLGSSPEQQPHWLPAKLCIDFKILLFTFNTLHNLSPPYLSKPLHISTPSRSLRTTSSVHLSVPPARLVTMGGRVFSRSALRLWNSLLPHIRNLDSLPLFKSRLKTHLFRMHTPLNCPHCPSLSVFFFLYFSFTIPFNYVFVHSNKMYYCYYYY